MTTEPPEYHVREASAFAEAAEGALDEPGMPPALAIAYAAVAQAHAQIALAKWAAPPPVIDAARPS